jgi:hypothetical protein
MKCSRRIKEASVVGLQSGVLDDFFHEEGGLLRASQPGAPDVGKRQRGFSLGAQLDRIARDYFGWLSGLPLPSLTEELHEGLYLRTVDCS